MDFYNYWLIRSRVTCLVGVLLFLGPVWVPWIRDWAHSWLLVFSGLGILAFGALDAFGLIQRKKVKASIEDHNKKYRSRFGGKNNSLNE